MNSEIFRKIKLLRKSLFLLLIYILIPSFSCKSSSTENINSYTREPAVSGAFYPSDPDDLKNKINSYLKSVKKIKIEEKIIGLIVPHAGYVYSGGVAAYAYEQLNGKKINTVIILGSSHRYPLSYPSIYLKGKYKTPLGEVPINEDLAEEIKNQFPSMDFIPEAHKHEHSIEVQIPFLQTVLKESFYIVPILLGNINNEILNNLSNILFNILQKEKNIIIIASSDLSHYPAYQDAVKVDMETINLIKNFKTSELIKRERNVKKSGIDNLATYQCGLGPIQVILRIAKKYKESSNLKGISDIILLDYKNSGDSAFGEKNKVVGYTSLAVVIK